MTRYEREEWIGGWQSLYHSDDLEAAVRYVKGVHANSGNHVRVTQIPGRQGTMSETVFEIPERAAFRPCPRCGGTAIELRMTDSLEFAEIRHVLVSFSSSLRCV